MYKILIVEDETEQREALARIIRDAFPNFTIYEVGSYSDAINILNVNDITFSFFFLDVDLGESEHRNGLTLGDFIRSHPIYEFIPIVYITSFSEHIMYALNTLHCSSYLVKPYSSQQVISSISNLLLSPLTPTPQLEINDVNGINFTVLEKDIIFAKAELKTIKIYTQYDIITTRQHTLTSLVAQITSPYILRCHKKYVVNLAYCDSYDRTYKCIGLKAPHHVKESIFIGRNYKALVEERLNNRNV